MTKFVENINKYILVLLSPPHNETGRLCLPVVWRRAIYCRFHAFARSLGRARLSPKHEPRDFFLPSLSAAQRNREALPPCCVAEREGFEPPEAFTSTVFKTAAFDHSAISPYLVLCGQPNYFNRRINFCQIFARDGQSFAIRTIIAAYCRAFCNQLNSLILFMAAMRLSTPSFK